jgi:RyR domain
VNAEDIARVCHEVNRAYCEALGDGSQPPWEQAPQWQRDSALLGVHLHLGNPAAGAQASHESWSAQKVADGWKYGPVKDPEKKEHPCLVPFADLPREQQAKDYLFRGVVLALAPKA